MTLHVPQTLRASVPAPAYQAVHGQRGFSLVEMLAALVILGLALGALYQAASGATRNARVSAEYAIATTLAESELDAFVISRPDVGTTQRGRYGDYAEVVTSMSTIGVVDAETIALDACSAFQSPAMPPFSPGMAPVAALCYNAHAGAPQTDRGVINIDDLAVRTRGGDEAARKLHATLSKLSVARQRQYS